MGVVLASALPLTASAQIPLNVDAKVDQAAVPQMGGVPAMDIISLGALGPGAPLRYGGVVPGSERVSLDGEMLASGPDYMVDYAAGVVYLKRGQRAGQSLSVSYRYTPGTATTSSAFATPGTFKLDLMPSNMQMMLGFGVAERTASGSVLQSNIFGFNNSMNMGQGKLTGLYVFGNRMKTSNSAGMSFDRSNAVGSAAEANGNSQMIVQNFASKLMGGSAQLDYQSIDKDFASFGSAKEAGYDDAGVQRLTKERGLKRMGFSFSDLKFGSMGLTDSYKTVSDGDKAITWRSLGVSQGGLKVNWKSQDVDNGFTRFTDLAEGDRDQLSRETNMSRQNLSAEFSQKAGKLSYTACSIDDHSTGKDISRTEWKFDASNLKLVMGNQEVGNGFNRFPSLTGDEQGMYGREMGLHRQWLSLNSAILGKNTPLSFSQSALGDGNGGNFRAQDMAVTGKTWNIVHSVRSADTRFGSLAALSDAETDGHIKAIAGMYGPGTAFSANDRPNFQLSAGLEREYNAFQSQPFKNWNLSFGRLDLRGKDDDASVTTIALAGKNAQFNYRRQALGDKFNTASLMSFEQGKLGLVSGLDRTDMGMNVQLGGKKLDVTHMEAASPTGGAEQTNLAFQDKKIDVQVHTREVDPGFSNASMLTDAATSLMGTLVGYKERDAHVKWNLAAGLKIDALMSENENTVTDQMNRIGSLSLDWTPNKTTSLQYYSFNQDNHDPLSTVFASSIERLKVSKNFGKYGTVQYAEETQTFDKAQTQLTDFKRQYMSYETKLDARTSVRTEQTRTQFEGGGKEDISANTISTALSTRLGVSVTDTKVDRQGTQQTTDVNVAHRNYGFWYDLGHGLLVSYGYARQLNDAGQGTMSSTVAIGQKKDGFGADSIGNVGQGNLGDSLSIGGGYGVNEWDAGNRTQSFSNFAVASKKPLKWGLMTDIKFNFGLDTAADYGNWIRENKVFGMAGKLLGNSFSYDYKGQMDVSGVRAIDRTFNLQTDPSDKKWLRANIFYKVRTLPTNEQIMIRNFAITARPIRNLELTTQLQTNPEVVQSNVLLGSVTQASRSNKWKLDYKRDKNMTIGASWEELINDQNNTAARTGGATLKLFEAKGSPVSLFYGMESADQTDLHRLTQRYSLQFDQRPGVDQRLSFFLGNLSYDRALPDATTPRNNWTGRIDYQFRFSSSKALKEGPKFKITKDPKAPTVMEVGS